MAVKTLVFHGDERILDMLRDFIQGDDDAVLRSVQPGHLPLLPVVEVGSFHRFQLFVVKGGQIFQVECQHGGAGDGAGDAKKNKDQQGNFENLLDLLLRQGCCFGGHCHRPPLAALMFQPGFKCALNYSTSGLKKD